MSTSSEIPNLISLVTNTLTRLGFLKSATTNFGAVEEFGVRAFQQERGLIVSGEIDAPTIRAIEEARWKLGDRVLSFIPGQPLRGDDVATLQSRLVEMGFDCGRVDAIFAEKTEVAVKDFQKSCGVKADGVCGPVTIMSLMRLMKTVSGGAPTQLRDIARRAVRGPALANKIIVLDPSSLPEDHEITFDISQRLEGRLIALGVTVFLSRSSQKDPDENERIDLANRSGADLVISFHTDNYENDLAHGIATYYYGNEQHGVHSVVGERFAALAQREITARTDLLNCHTHAKSWDLLRLTKAPTVRIDLGYLSNPGDMKRLLDPAFRETVVESIVVAIQRLYLSAENDAKTGTLKISDLRRAGLRKN
jgi:N-acetylmuramoyl-L-alanine amidase